MKCYIYGNVTLAYSSILTVCDNAGRIKEGLGMERKCLCSKTTAVLSEWTVPIMYDVGVFV